MSILGNNMNTVKLKGGLGNQLYQIAAINAHCKDNNLEFFIDYDLHHACGQGRHPSVYREGLFKNFKPLNISSDFELYIEPTFTYTKIPKIEKNVMFDGYFQSYKYFEKYKQELNNWFSLDAELTKTINNNLDKLRNKTNKKIVGVHIRRGDYTHNPDIHPTITKKYYDKARQLFNDHVFVYATDDYQRVHAEFKFNDSDIHVNGKNELYDFHTLSLCDSIIIGNSSFAAWSSYLGNKKEKVVAPSTWFGPRGPDYTDLLDKDWTILKL